MAIPLLLVVCVNSLGLDAIETPFFKVPKLLQDRTGEVGFSLAALKGKLAALLRVLTTDRIFGSSQHFWNLYQVSVPFTIAGGIHTLIETGRSIRHRRQSLHPYLLFWCVGSAVTMLLAGTYTYHVNGIFVALVVFTVDGIMLSLQKLPFRRVLCPMILCAYAVSALGFCGEYFVAGGRDSYQVYGGVDAALMQIPDELQDREIYIPDEIGEIYFLSHPLSPEEVLTYCDAYGMVRDYGRLHFRQPQQYEPEMILILNENNGFCPETLWGETFREEKVGHYRLLYGQ